MQSPSGPRIYEIVSNLIWTTHFTSYSYFTYLTILLGYGHPDIHFRVKKAEMNKFPGKTMASMEACICHSNIDLLESLNSDPKKKKFVQSMLLYS